jgi:hypothetical protein
MNFRIISPGKALLIILFDLIVCISVWAQSPDKLTYQAVIRNSSGGLVQKQAVNIRISILQGSSGGNSVYEEIQKATTNANGLVTLEFGGGAKWDKIDWAKGPFYIKTETDPTGGNNLSISGTSQLVSVPYALYAKTAGKVNEKDSIFKTSAAGTIIYDDLKNWSNAYNWGDHSKAGYIKSFTETDPLFMASPAKAISSANITNWSKAYSWGNHADAGYLTSATESDPIFNREYFKLDNSLWLGQPCRCRLFEIRDRATFYSLCGQGYNFRQYCRLEYSLQLGQPCRSLQTHRVFACLE